MARDQVCGMEVISDTAAGSYRIERETYYHNHLKLHPREASPANFNNCQIQAGNRFSALQPISMGLIKHYGSVQAAVARGLTLRMDNGSQYLSEHFQNQIKFWGIAPSFAFVREPETNGVVERFNRTLKEQAIYGRIFRTIEEVRAAMAVFVANYNKLWQVEKLNFKSPDQAREDFCKKAA